MPAEPCSELLTEHEAIRYRRLDSLIISGSILPEGANPSSTAINPRSILDFNDLLITVGAQLGHVHRIQLLLIEPREVVRNSIMPRYPWLAERAANADNDIQLKMRVLEKLGHPYSEEDIEAAPAALEGLMEIDALIAYLQALGTSKKPGDIP